MSGWIKMGVGLRRHPKVVRMASALKADKLRVIGALHAVWCVFDEHSDDGHLDCYTPAAMDDEIGWRGFSNAMQAIGWLVETGDGLQAPDYEEHNGVSAKRRALDAQSKGKRRHSSASIPPDDKTNGGKGHGQMSARDADTTPNRIDKRRKEEEKDLGRAADVGKSLREPQDPPPEVNGHAPTKAGLMCRAMKAAGMQAVNPGDPRLLALIEQGATEAEFAGAAAEATERGKGFAYALKALEGKRADAAEIALKPAVATDWRDSRREVIDRGTRMGLLFDEIDSATGRANSWQAYRQRVIQAIDQREQHA